MATPRDLIIAAVPAELGPLVRGWSAERRGSVRLWTRGTTRAACAGIGQAAALRALAAAEADGPIRRLISAGFAGAARPGYAAGSCHLAGGALDPATGERVSAAGGREDCWVATLDRIAGPAEKRGVALEAALVDMEAVAVGRAARERGVPFYCVKAVTDGPEETLPDFAPFVTESGEIRTGALAGHALVRPLLWPRLLRLAAVSGSAARALKETVGMVLDSPIG